MKTVLSHDAKQGARASDETAAKIVAENGFHYVPKSVMKRWRNKQRQQQAAQRKRQTRSK